MRLVSAAFAGVLLLAACQTERGPADPSTQTPQAQTPAAARTVTDLPTRPGVTQRVLVLAPEAPVATVVLFAGGSGILNIDPQGGIGAAGNFLIRTAGLWAGQGFQVAIVDAPSDRHDGAGLSGVRMTPDTAADVAAVVRFLRSRSDRPVWLIGTSQGTNAVANAASQLGPPELAGIVLTSTLTRTHPNHLQPRETVFDVNLSRITVPVLIASHNADRCRATSPQDAERLRAGLTGAPRTEVMLFQGGAPARSGPCEARSEHGFLGIEDQVVDRIGGWIKTATLFDDQRP